MHNQAKMLVGVEMMEKYVALIADLKDSRELTEKARIECQEKLYTIINKLNLILNNSLFKKLVFSAGDSIQGLFYNLKDAIYCYYLIKNFLYPYEIRSGLDLVRFIILLLTLKTKMILITWMGMLIIKLILL